MISSNITPSITEKNQLNTMKQNASNIIFESDFLLNSEYFIKIKNKVHNPIKSMIKSSSSIN